MPDQQKLLNAIDNYSAQSLGSGQSDNGELSFQRSRALDAYAGKMLDVPPEGRSTVNDRSLFETVQWMMPSFQRIFAGGDNVVEFDPTGPEDEEIAEQESDYLNFLVTQRNDWDLIVREWTQDACLTKNAYCLVEMVEIRKPEIEFYEGQSEDQVAMLVEDDLEIIGQNHYDDPNDPGFLLDPATGEPIDPNDTATFAGAMAIYEANGVEPQVQRKQLYDIQVREVKAKKRLNFDVLAPEWCKIGKDTTDFTLENCNYFEYWDPTVTISDMRKEGYDIPDDIEGTAFEWTEEDSSRNEPLESDVEIDSDDPAMKRVTKRLCWIRHDYDEDGIAELQKVTLVGRAIVDMEPASRIPVACIVPWINTHRHMGTSVADLIFEVQRIKTDMLRNGLDALRLAQRPRHAVSRKVKVDDLLSSIPGSAVRMLDKNAVPGEGHIMPLVTENTFPYAQQGLEYMDRVIESRAGVNRMFQGIDSSNLNDYDRVGQLSTMAAQRIEDIARCFAIGFKRLFSLAHEAVIKGGHQAEAVKLRGQWVSIDPTQWRTGRDMRVTAPFAAGNKDSLLQRLLVIANIHEKALAGGLPIVDAQDSYNLALEIGKAADLPATKFFTDPSTIPPPEPQPDYTAVALQIEDKKANTADKNVEVDAEIDRYKADLDAQVKQYQTDVNSQTQLALAQIKEGQQVNLEKLKAGLKVNPIDFEGEQVAVSDAFAASKAANEQMAAILADSVDKMAEALANANGAKRVVRENGKIVGVEPA